MKSITSYFELEKNNTTVGREALGGMTTFLTMSYIIFVQPAMLGTTGMDRGAVMVATCISSAIATLMMGLLARYPIAVAPAMGHNAFFAFRGVRSLDCRRVRLHLAAGTGGRHDFRSCICGPVVFRFPGGPDQRRARVVEVRHRGRHRAA